MTRECTSTSEYGCVYTVASGNKWIEVTVNEGIQNNINQSASFWNGFFK